VQVRAYAAVFFERYMELQEHEKHMKQIERGEQKIQRQHDIMKVRHQLRLLVSLYQQMICLDIQQLHKHAKRSRDCHLVRDFVGQRACFAGHKG
jgi:hypothetical protein